QQLHPIGLDQDVDDERASGLSLAVQAVAAVGDQGARGQPVANRSARAAALEWGAHLPSSRPADGPRTRYVSCANWRSRATSVSSSRAAVSRRGRSGAPPPSVTGAIPSRISSSSPTSANCPTSSPPPTSHTFLPPGARA